MADSRSRRQKSYQPGPEQVIVEAIFRGLWHLISWPFRRQKKSGGRTLIPSAVAVQLGSHWSSVEQNLQSPQTFSIAVAEADKLLDAGLQAAGVIGQTMGDRLKAAASLFPKPLYDEIWRAHKLRNTLAHEVGAAVSENEVRMAVGSFRSALHHLGIL